MDRISSTNIYSVYLRKSVVNLHRIFYSTDFRSIVVKALAVLHFQVQIGLHILM